MRSRPPKLTWPWAALLLVLVLGGALEAHAQTDTLTLRVNESREARFRRQVVGVAVQVSAVLPPAGPGVAPIVRVSLGEDYGVRITGLAPGTADVVISGRLVQYQIGIPREGMPALVPEGQRPPRRGGDIPPQRFVEFSLTYRVTVSDGSPTQVLYQPATTTLTALVERTRVGEERARALGLPERELRAIQGNLRSISRSLESLRTEHERLRRGAISEANEGIGGGSGPQ